MSVHVVSWAWKQIVGDALAKLVLIKLADNADEDGFSWWRQKKLADECEISRATVQRKLEHLQNAGFLEISERREDNGRQRSNGYRILRTVPQAEAPPRLTGEAPPASLVRHKEPSVEPSVTLAAEAARRDHVWEALELVFGAVTNEGSRARRSKAVKLVKQSLEAAGVVDPEEIVSEVARRARTWQQTFASAPLTDIALANGWDRAVRRSPASAPRSQRDESEPEVLPPEENARRLRDLREAMQTIGKEIP